MEALDFAVGLWATRACLLHLGAGLVAGPVSEPGSVAGPVVGEHAFADDAVRPLSPAGQIMMRGALSSRIMRTTLDIDDDVLLAAKETAQRDKRSVGDVISDLARRALLSGAAAPTQPGHEPTHPGLAKLGIQPLPKRGGIVTNELINQLRDDGIY
jgi:hypothetical protein